MTQLHILDPHPNGNPGVLLLHGLGATGESWGLQFPALIEAGFRPLAPDAPGFGESRYSGEGWSIKCAAEHMAEVLEDRKTGSVHVVGLSMGGVIAQQFAYDFPQLTKKLVLTSTFSALRPDNFSGWIYFLRRMFAISFLGLPAQAKVVAGRVFPGPDQAELRAILVATIAGADTKAYRAAMRSLGFFNSHRWLKELQAPTLVVTGAEDSTVSPKLQKQLVDGIPGARQAVIEGAGHAVPIDRADEFNRIVLEFLR